MNKKKIFGFLAVLIIAAGAVWNVNLNSQKNDLSALSLANVEALAQNPGEGGTIIIHCCGNYGECIIGLTPNLTTIIVAGTKMYLPCL
jgi:hypothetical protein